MSRNDESGVDEASRETIIDELIEWQTETKKPSFNQVEAKVLELRQKLSEEMVRVTYTYRVFRLLTAYFVKTTAGPNFSILFAVTPIELLESTGWMWISMNYGHDIPEAELRAFQDEIVSQDVPIVESQRPELLPLDSQAELHLRSDRTAIAYRQWLTELALVFGTA